MSVAIERAKKQKMKGVQPIFRDWKGFVVVVKRACGVVGENFCEVSKKSNLLSQSQITGCCGEVRGFSNF